MNRKMKHAKTRRFTAFLLCLSMIMSMVSGIGVYTSAAAATGSRTADGGTTVDGREADPSTMDTYIEMLNFDENSRYAGRIWTDKTVFANGQSYTGSGDDAGRTFDGSSLTLSQTLDGVGGSISLDADFLTAFSALGSSQEVNENVNTPIDLVILLDMSGSMAAVIDETQSNRFERSRMGQTLKAINSAIDTLMSLNETNRVAVIGYGTTAYTLMELGHYKSENGTYLSMEDLSSYDASSTDNNYGTGSGAYTVHVKAQKESTLGDEGTYQLYERRARNSYSHNGESNSGSTTLIGYHTDLQAGIWQGFNELLDKMKKPEDVTYTYTSKATGQEKTIARIPAAFVMTDGGSNVALGNANSRTGDEWYDLDSLITQQMTGVNSLNDTDHLKYRSEKDGSEGDAVILDILLTASLMKSRVLNKYKELLDKSAVSDADKKSARFEIHSVSVDTPDTNWQIPRVYATLDPKNYFNANPPELPGNVAWNQKEDVIGAYDSWQKWVEAVNTDSEDSITAIVDTHNGPQNDNAQIPFKILSSYEEERLGVKNQDIIDNILYNDSFADIGAADLEETFNTLLSSLGTSMFTPVTGSNDLGVDSAVTYKDPIGQYMEVKDVKNMVLFGSNYELQKAAMYNYSFVSQHRAGGEGTFQSGWYHFDANGDWWGDSKEGGWQGALQDRNCYLDGTGGNVPETTWQTLSDGSYWAYFVSSPIAMQFVPTVASDASVSALEGTNPDQADKFKNTTYTIYRIDKKDGQTLTSGDRNTLHMNPAYGTDSDIPASVQYDAENQEHLNSPGVYALSDLRIWVEDTGDYSDAGGDTLSDSNYDEALFVNLPANMLPLRTVTIDYGKDDSGQITYTTNLPKGDSVQAGSAESASFPFRVFYTVGVEESLLTGDGSIDVAALSAEYIEQNKVKSGEWAEARNLEENDVEFFANWYNPENRYSDYVTTGTDYSYGDPVVSFSPSTDNRYYVFQKALPLYKRALVWVPQEDLVIDSNKTVSTQVGKGGLWKIAKVNDDDYTPKENEVMPGESYGTSDFGGVVLASDLTGVDLNEVDEEGAKANAENQENIWEALTAEVPSLTDGTTLAKGTVIFLEDDRLKDVTKQEPNDPFSSDSYYFMAIEYYELGEDGTATQVQYALTRKGSEFGSAYKAAGISNGDMLCWYDASGKYPQVYPYLSASDTGDNSRGRDYIGLPLTNDGEYDTVTGDFTLEKGVPSKKNTEVDGAEAIYKGGTWVVAAKPGGLRVGALAQAVGEKGTELSEAYTEYATARFPGKGLTVQYYEDGNTTRTANNYYLPTISTSSAAGAQDLVVNVYLGNNGRLWVQDTLLLVTKLLEETQGQPLPENSGDKEFDFQVTIAGQSAKQSVNAVRVRYNEAQGAWQRQLHYIDMELGEKWCLQTSEGSAYLVDKTGTRQVLDQGDGSYIYADDKSEYNDEEDGGPYYVFVGKNSEDTQTQQGGHVFRVYHNPECDVSNEEEVSSEDVIVELYDSEGKTTVHQGGTLPVTETGKRNFYANTVYLLTEEQREKVDENGILEGLYTKTIAKFLLATLNPTDTESSDIKVTSPYRTKSEYLTQTVYFGYDNEKLEAWLAENDGKGYQEAGEDCKLDGEDLFVNEDLGSVTKEQLPANTAQVTLESGWGLLFPGLASGADYRLVEKVGQDDLNEGYSFKRVEHVQQESTTTTNVTDEDVDNPDRIYSVSGDTGAKEEAGHFVNTWSTTKTETQVNGSPVEPSEEDGSLYPGVQVGDTITYQIEWYNDAKGEGGAAAKAVVEIVDPLDEGVDFVSATDGGVYDKATHTVTWDLGEQEANANGSVSLTVKVNDKAQAYWDYDGDGTGDEAVSDTDFLVRDRATVRVADNSYHTNTVVNPVGKPDKTETRIDHADAGMPDVEVHEAGQGADANLVPGEDGKLHGPLVFVGDKITYEIEWQNYRSEPAAITVRDPLDQNVSFVSASFQPSDILDSEGTVLTLDNGLTPLMNPGNQTLEAGGGGTVSTQGGQISGYGEEGRDSRDVIKYDKDKHEVTWNLGVMPSGAHGKVTLVVEVLDTATPVGYVDNTAYVTVNGDPEQKTETIENPTPHQEKTEVTPGDGVMVGVGDEITYAINWHNYQAVPATVTIKDTLDPGVDFVEASDGGTYDGDSHTVTWELGEQEAGAEGTVTLTVRTNEKAKETYNYNDDASALTPTPDEKDYEVLNQARVKVGNDPYVKTEIVENPVPEKTETDVNHVPSGGSDDQDPTLTPREDAENTYTGPLVYVGDEITYQIHWTNGHDEKATVTIRDALDPGVDFVSAGSNGSYDSKSHTVTWVLQDQEAHASGTVELKVKVNEKATPAGIVDNQALVKVGTDPVVETEIIENPTPHVEKTEVSPGEGMQVMPGDEIEYEISWHNYDADAADVTITDKLDPGVDFLEAAYLSSKLSASEETKKPETADLTIFLAEDEGINEEFTFTLELTLPEGKEVPEAGYAWQVSGDQGASGNWKNDVGNKELTLKPGESVTVKDLPVGTTYTLTPAEGEAIVTGAALGVYGSTVRITASAQTVSLPAEEELPAAPQEQDPAAGGDPASGAPAEAEPSDEESVPGTTEVSGGDAEETTTVTPDLAGAAEGEATATESEDPEATGDAATVSSGDAATDPAPTTGPASDPAPTTGPTTDPTQTDGPATDPTQTDGPTAEEPEGPTEPDPAETEPETMTVYTFSAIVTDAPMPIADPDESGVETPTEYKTVDQYGEIIIRYYPESHKVEWVLKNRPANASGVVNLKVRVNEDAEKFWSYGNPEWGPSENENDDRVRNQAGVKVGNHPEVKTRIIENPTEPEKTETHINDTDVSRDLVADERGYVGPEVNVGDSITYRITWQNNAKDEAGQPAKAEITIEDELDPGVTFLEASDDGSYDPETHTVTWKLGEKEARDRGYVTLKVRVTSAALDGEDTVENDAVVTVGNESTVTDRVENPVGDLGALTVTKTVTGNRGEKDREWHFTVELSDLTLNGVYGEMTFTEGVAEFTLKHGESKTASGLPADITYIVTEEEADEDGYTTSAEGDTGTIPAGGTAEAGFVNRRSDGPDPHKTEVTPGDGQEVQVGDEITYNITWQNREAQTATVIIRDPLDPGVDFVSADNGGAYDEATHTVTWTFEAESDAEGVVSLTVRVNENAEQAGIVYNQAFVKVGNGPEIATEIPENPVPTPGSLTVTKTVTGKGDRSREWHFRVELGDKAINGQYGDMEFTNGVAEFTLKHGESKTASGLPEGTTYQVTEREENQDGYATTYTDDAGTITHDQDMVAAFVNDIPEPAQPDNPPDNPDNPPSGPDNPPNSPQTGDNSHLGLWCALMVISILGVIGSGTVLFKERRKASYHGRRTRHR